MVDKDQKVSGNSNIKGAICYIPFIGWIISTFYILTERDDHFLRFNALQSLLLLLVYIAISITFNILNNLVIETSYPLIITGIARNILPPLYLLISLLLIFKTYNGERLMLLLLGNTAERHM